MSGDSLKRLYLDSMGALREARGTILAVVILFLISAAFGIAHPSWSEGSLSAMKGLARDLSGRSVYGLILILFLKNSLSTAIAVLLGPFLGIVPLLGAIINGLLLGSVFTYVSEANKVNAIFYLLPHGFFEFPAMFMAWGLGLWQGIWFFQKHRRDSLKERRNRALRILFLIILPLLLVAATIEGTNIYLMQAGSGITSFPE